MATIAALPLHINTAVAFPVDPIATVINGGKKEDRVPQWGYQETKDFITIRAELEKDFTQTKRNKSLWEIIALKMKERGHRRSADQCKCKWKNLSNRYKAMAISQGMETTDLENGRPCPFYGELHSFFTERDKTSDGRLTEAEGSERRKGRKGLFGERSSEDLSDEEEDDDEDSEDERLMKRSKKSRLTAAAEKCRANTMQEVLEEFFQQQHRVEREWMEALQRREEERRRREQEWRETMEKVEKERLAREQLWRDREEQRRTREEARAHKRDALFSALLSRLAAARGGDDSPSLPPY